MIKEDMSIEVTAYISQSPVNLTRLQDAIDEMSSGVYYQYSLLYENEILTSSEKKKQILNDLSASIEFVKQHRAGKVKPKAIAQLLNEL